jgi:hypothetical protein
LEVRQVIEAVEVRERNLDRTGMVQANATLRSPWQDRAAIDDLNVLKPGRYDEPSLIEQRHAAGREARDPHGFDGIAIVQLSEHAHARDSEQLRVDHVQKVVRRESVGGADDVSLAPPEELSSDIDGELAVRQRRGQSPERNRRPLDRAIGVKEPKALVDLVVRVDAEVEASGQLQPWRGLHEHVLPN